MADNCVTRALSGALETAKIYAGAIRDEFTEKGYYAEKFKGTQGVGDAMLRVGSVYKDSGKIMLNGAKTLATKNLVFKAGTVVADKVKENLQNPKTIETFEKYHCLGLIPLALLKNIKP